MELIILCLAGYGAYILWKGVSRGGLMNLEIPFITYRGLLTVKAVWYLIYLEQGKTVDEANMIVKHMDVGMPQDMILFARDFARNCYGGKQLPLIEEARLKGLKE